MKGYDTAAPLHHPIDELDAFGRGQMGCLPSAVAIPAVRYDHDGVGRFQSSRLHRPTIEECHHLHLLSDIRILEHRLQQAHRPGVVVNSVPLGPMALDTGDQDDLLFVHGPHRYHAQCQKHAKQEDAHVCFYGIQDL